MSTQNIEFKANFNKKDDWGVQDNNKFGKLQEKVQMCLIDENNAECDEKDTQYFESLELENGQRGWLARKLN